jgi:hypothetical integral membrane protein (TIGR02206 family)
VRPPFVLFGPDHLAVLVATPLAAALLVPLVRRDREGPLTRALRVLLAAALVFFYSAVVFRAWREGWLDLQLVLPLHLCDLAVILAVYSLLTLQPRTVEPLFFWGIAGSGIAIVTPDLHHGFPDWDYFFFFVPHAIVVVAAFLLTFGLRIVPPAGAWWRVFLLTLAYAGLVAVVNLALGTNFLFLRRKPAGQTLLDWFGPWPVYILVAAAIALALFWLLDRPLRRLRGAV